jgi:hypothetical protein
MSSINIWGQILHGVGGGQASIDNNPFSQGAAGGWFDDRTAFFADGENEWIISLYDRLTKNRGPAIIDPTDRNYGKGGNALYSDGGVWAAWLNGTGIYASTGFNAPRGGLLGVGPDGTIGFKPDYHSNGPSYAHEINGDQWLITAGHAADLRFLGDRRAIWQEGNRIHVLGLPQPVQVGGAWGPEAFYVKGRWWISYWSDVRGIVLHPIDDLTGYILVPYGVDCWKSGRVLSDGTLRFAFSSGEGEQPGQVEAHDVDFSQTPINLAPVTHNDVPHSDAPPPHNDAPPPHHDAPQPHNDVPPPSPFLHHKGVSMTSLDGKTVRLRGVKGMLIRPDAPNTGMWKDATPPGWRGGIFDGINDDDERCHYVAKAVGNRYTFTNKMENCLIGEDAGWYSTAIDQQLYHKPTDNTDAGDLELWRVYDGNDNGAIEAQCEHTSDDKHPSGAGKKFFAYPLSVEVV